MKRIVVIGGGTGTYTVLSGLKEYPVHLSAIVAMSDNGGSTGVLRDELGVLPPGDIRRSLIALSESPQIIRDLFNYRFESGGLEGHSFGNLFLTALEKITGNFEEAVKEAGKVLSIRGDVIPATIDNTHLYATLEDGTVVTGETNIDIPKHDGKLRIRDVALKPMARATKSARKAILSADLIVLSPGDLFTSLIPNLLVKGIPEAIRASKANVVYCCNLTTKHGETNGFGVDDFASKIEQYLGKGEIDYVIAHQGTPPKKLLSRYRKEHKEPVIVTSREHARPYRLIPADIASSRNYFRHDAEKLGKILMMLTEFDNVLNFLGLKNLEERH